MALKKLWGRHMTCMKASRQAGMVQAGFDATKREVKEK
jgi:hypothetical protein